MARIHSRASARTFLSLALALAFALSALPGAAFAAPTNKAIEAKKAEAEAAEAALEDMQADLEERMEAYEAITQQLAETRQHIEAARAEIEAADAELATDRQQLNGRVVGMYKNGTVPLLEVLLGTTSFDDFLSRFDLMARIGRSDAALIARVETARERVAAAKATLESRESEQVVLRAEAKTKRDAVEAASKRQAGYVKTLNTEVARLIAEERERQRKLAEARAKKAAEEARRRREAAERAARDNSVTLPTGGGRSAAVEVALRYLGVPYVWGGTTPSGFDCSGLTQYVYREIGISIPRTSRQQFRAGTHISRNRLDLLEPGDLVFFGRGGSDRRVHHVGIYAGNGNYIHAPQTGDVVRVSSLTDRISRRRDYVGASRF